MLKREMQPSNGTALESLASKCPPSPAATLLAVGPVPGRLTCEMGCPPKTLFPLHGEELILALPEAVEILEAAGLPYPRVPPCLVSGLLLGP